MVAALANPINTGSVFRIFRNGMVAFECLAQRADLLQQPLGLHAVQAARVQNTFVLAHTFLYGLPPPFTAFALFVIAGTFWYCGTKPGILAALISWRLRDYLFEPEAGAESRISVWLGVLGFCIRDDPVHARAKRA